ncbi:Double-stranded RNA-binding domain [Dillenia turbinata]|uniref:Double-stranded RNA-binding domain n=1 Tax=Dillenia turbinata TaxID=194707 RepID=A0AAN8VIM3_9MAGN
MASLSDGPRVVFGIRGMYKNQLQELAQRSCFNLPAYACIREGPDHAPRFKATVNFNGETFESPTFCSTLRQAEHAAAEVALNVLSKKGPSRALAAKVLDETGVYKNLLQETAHRAGLKLPVYTTIRSGPGHVPVFTCTVELAGMVFRGEPAKTKKQAQKSAAMAAWSSLKRSAGTVSNQGSSSSSSLSELGGNDEQEHVIVARYLASIHPSETSKLTQRDRRYDQRGSIRVQRDMILYSEGLSVQGQNWAYTEFNPELSICHSWDQQGHVLALPTTTTPHEGAHIFPFIHSMILPNHNQLYLPRAQDCVSLVPSISPFLCFPNNPMPPPVKSTSQVTIQEIEETLQVEDKWPPIDSKSSWWTFKFPSNPSASSPVEDPNIAISPNNHSEIRTQASLQEKDEGSKSDKSGSIPTTGNTNSKKSVSHEQNDCHSIDPQLLGGCLTSRATTTDSSGVLVINPSDSSPRLIRSFAPTSLAAPVMVRNCNVNSISSGTVRPRSPNQLPPTAPTRSFAFPSMRYTGGIPSARFMAPAVQIRSVVPVCAAAPQQQRPHQQELLSQGEKMRTAKPDRDVSEASLELSKLQI